MTAARLPRRVQATRIGGLTPVGVAPHEGNPNVRGIVFRAEFECPKCEKATFFHHLGAENPTAHGACLNCGTALEFSILLDEPIPLET